MKSCHGFREDVDRHHFTLQLKRTGEVEAQYELIQTSMHMHEMNDLQRFRVQRKLLAMFRLHLSLGT